MLKKNVLNVANLLKPKEPIPYIALIVVSKKHINKEVLKKNKNLLSQ